MTKDLIAAPMPAPVSGGLPFHTQATPPAFPEYRRALCTVDNRLGVYGTGAFIDKKMRPSSLTDRPPG